MPRVPEVHEPLAVDGLGHLLEDLDAAVGVCNEGVGARQQLGYASLGSEGRQMDVNRVQVVAVDTWHRTRSISCPEVQLTQEVGDELPIAPLKVDDVEAGIERPEVVLDVEHLAECAIAAGDDTG